MKMNRRNILKYLTASSLGLGLLFGFFSCAKDPNSPGYEFAPDMYRSPSLEVYNYILTKGGDTILSARTPVSGTISRGNIPSIPPGMNYEGSVALINPLHPANDNAACEKLALEGEIIYGKYCVQCHGATGMGDGKVGGKLPGPPPAYNGALKDLPAGKIFYSISYGKGMMGAHAPMLTANERWKLVCFVQKLQGPKTVVTDSIAGAEKPVLEENKTK
jgi:mono/diheme cytochrome c family protein